MYLLSLFDDIDLVKILGFGLTGLSLLLMILAYRLLNQLIAVPSPNALVISLVKWYLGITVMVLVVVGIFSFPLANKNSELKVTNTTLNKNVTKLIADSQMIAQQNNVLLTSSEVNAHLDTLKQAKTTQKINKELKQIKNISAGLPQDIKYVSPSLKDDVVSFKDDVDSLIMAYQIQPLKDSSKIIKSNIKNAALLKDNFNEVLFRPIKAELKSKQ